MAAKALVNVIDREYKLLTLRVPSLPAVDFDEGGRAWKPGPTQNTAIRNILFTHVFDVALSLALLDKISLLLYTKVKETMKIKSSIKSDPIEVRNER